MLKASRLEMFSEQELFLIIWIADGWIHRTYQTPDLCNTPRFSKTFDYLVLGPKNNRWRQPVCLLH